MMNLIILSNKGICPFPPSFGNAEPNARVLTLLRGEVGFWREFLFIFGNRRYPQSTSTHLFVRHLDRRRVRSRAASPHHSYPSASSLLVLRSKKWRQQTTQDKNATINATNVPHSFTTTNNIVQVLYAQEKNIIQTRDTPNIFIQYAMREGKIKGKGPPTATIKGARAWRNGIVLVTRNS